MTPFIDPRDGDIESDASSPKNRSMLALAGSLIAEISLPKLIVAWLALIGLPALMLGAMPIFVSVWLNLIASEFKSLLYGIIPALFLITIVIVGVLGVRRLFRLAERSFWSLNSLAVQPIYAVCRELLNQIGDRLLPETVTELRRARWRSVTAALAGLTVCLISVAIFLLVLPHTRLDVGLSALSDVVALIKGALANSVAIVSAYVAVAVLIWAIADATMPPTRNFVRFATPAPGERRWRVAHLSDVHEVGEQYGFRIESGRSGPRGNGQFLRALERLDDIHAKDPLDAILVSGDLTDAGLATEWAEFLNALDAFPRLAPLILAIPGNHDLNIVSRANPAQFDLPTSPNKKLRKLRVLSALNAMQGDRVRVVDRQSRQLGDTLAQALAPHIAEAQHFADTGRPRVYRTLNDLWSNVFPMVLPPDRPDGLGILLLDSNADTHFSFTNALGMMPTDQYAGMAAAFAQYPHAGWVICIHHHIVEYPRAAAALSERIGTALINGQWFVRRLEAFADRIIVMHGHRHIDWCGECGDFPIISGPSTIMGGTANAPTYFYIHTIAKSAGGRLELLTPERIVVQVDPDIPSETAA
jgi:predicted MPP superfamily phosphohydrolase